ncbi:unnamed protein product [Cylindrotheca closterium]|uniref:DUF6824 domain-containing protein n=1 Tax=Cylindrotheca closterium TaxID=2856 RepID=A0AAD2JMY5_9STRA|nr:unnamed protein product [Cylindrotheca closterium]
MQGGLLNQEKPFPLPADFEPSKWDITIPCGWVKSKEHSGNARFLELCQQQLENYEKCTTKVERSVVIHRIVLTVMAGSPTQTGFVNRDKATGRWHFIGMTRARERVGYVLRRAIADKKAKREKANMGEEVIAAAAASSSKTTTPSKKSKADKKQQQSGLVFPGKLDSAEADAANAKSMASRRRKLPIGFARSKTTSCSSSSSSGEEEDSPKRRRTLPVSNVPFQRIVGSGDANNATTHTVGGKAALKEAIAIAKPSAAETGIARPLAAYPPAVSSLFPSATNDIYLEAAIREHAALRERQSASSRENAALRELAAWGGQTADAVLRERMAMREHATIRERLAFHEDAILRERLALHENAALRGQFSLHDRLGMGQQGDETNAATTNFPKTSMADALAAVKAMNTGAPGVHQSLTPTQLLQLGASLGGMSAFSMAGLPPSLFASLQSGGAGLNGAGSFQPTM